MTYTEERESQTHALAQSIAARMPEGWRYKKPAERNYCALIEGPDGMGLWISLDHKDKLTISGTNWPTDGHGHNYLPYSRDEYTTSIGVSISKTAEQIARDVERRLLPDYIKLYRGCLERKAADDAGKKAQLGALDILHGLFRQAEQRGERETPYLHYYSRGTSFSADVVVSHGGKQVKIILEYADVELAEIIVSAISRYLERVKRQKLGGSEA